MADQNGQLRIGPVALDNRLLLAPMAGVTACHFVCCADKKEQGWYAWR